MNNSLSNALWRIYNRPDRLIPWAYGGNLPWNEAEFSERMLREHLTQAHGAASRIDEERALQLVWLQQKMGIMTGDRVLDLTCGPGLYAVPLGIAGCQVDGIDFSPAAIAYAKALAVKEGVNDRVHFFEDDILNWSYPKRAYDHVLILYGQLAVMSREDAAHVLQMACQALVPGGNLVIELLDQEQVDKKDSSWWYTDEKRLWGDAPFLLLGERQWYADESLSMERYHVVHLETGQLDEVILCDQTYAIEEFKDMLHVAGFSTVEHYPAWDDIPLYDAFEWVVYLATTN